MNPKEIPPRCYYCDTNYYANVNEYEKHIVTKHPHFPGYPGPADLEALHLKAQGMSWERKVSEAEALELLRHYANKKAKMVRK